MVEQIRRYGYDDFDNPKYYNIRWMRLLEEAAQIVAVTGSVFEVPTQESSAARFEPAVVD
jgi:hypothetical protein